MHTRNETVVAAPPDLCLEAARDVERWPEILPHYRDVRFTRREGPGRGRVVMSAFRHFGPLPWPTWWASEMATDEEAREVRYRHVDGITTGMDVLWEIRSLAEEPGTSTGESPRTRIVVLHDWDGPGWPLIGGFAARRVIGPHFVKVVADRTLAGIRREVEARWSRSPDNPDAVDRDGVA